VDVPPRSSDVPRRPSDVPRRPSDVPPPGPPLEPAVIRALWDFEDPVGSQGRFAAAAADGTRPAGHRDELVTQVARALGLQGRFDEGFAALDAITADGGVVGVRVLLERGRLHRSAGDPAAAVPLFRAAVASASDVGAVALAVDALHMLVLADPEGAERWSAAALALVAASGDAEVERWSVPLLTNLGWSRFDAGRPAEALQAFGRAHAASTRPTGGGVGSDDEQVARWTVARCLRELGREAEALAMQRALLVERPDDPYVREELELLGGGSSSEGGSSREGGSSDAGRSAP